MTGRELELWQEMPWQWVRPMDVGGRDGSQHSAILASLVRKGYVERRRRCIGISASLGSKRGGYEYRKLGSQALYSKGLMR